MRRRDKEKVIRIVGLGSAALLSAGTVFLGVRFLRTRNAALPAHFAQKAFAGGLFEIESGQLALDRSENDEVCEFAHTMIDDHMRINRGLNTVLSKSNGGAAEIKKHLDSTHQKMLDELTETPDEKFDQAYIEAQKKAHREAIKLFGGYARKFGKDSILKSFAARILPTLKHHQQMAEGFELKELQS